jgi:hypothetical protein
MAATNALDSLIIGGHNMMQFVMQPGMVYALVGRASIGGPDGSVQCSSN